VFYFDQEMNENHIQKHCLFLYMDYEELIINLLLKDNISYSYIDFITNRSIYIIYIDKFKSVTYKILY